MQLSGKIVHIEENSAGIVLVEIAACDIGKALALLDALDCERIRAFFVKSETDSVIFQRIKSDCFEIKVKNGSRFLLNEDQFLLLRCCCIDRLLNINSDPWTSHVDLDCGKFDFTFGISAT